jgi:hypothetical protein
MTVLADWALIYAQRGLRVFPCRTAGKTPLTKHGFKDATTDEATIREWWKRRPDANIGIATGGGLMVLDVDGAKGQKTLAQAIVIIGELPETTKVKTSFKDGVRGEHIFFCYDTAKYPQIKSFSNAGIGLDVRADGGYVIAPPSSHDSGVKYELIPSETGIAEAPQWVLEYALSGGKKLPGFDVVPQATRTDGTASLNGICRNRGPSIRHQGAAWAAASVFVSRGGADTKCSFRHTADRTRDLVPSRRGIALDRLG